MTGAFEAEVPADERARDGGIQLVNEGRHDAEILAMSRGRLRIWRLCVRVVAAVRVAVKWTKLREGSTSGSAL
jgi:hypothetical protein